MKQQTKKFLATAVLLTCYSVPAWSETDIKTAQPDTQEEIRRLKNLIENNYQDIKSVNDLGVIQLKLGNYDEAITMFKKALEIDPSYSMGPFLFGDIYTDAERYEEKIDEFKKVIKRNHEYARANNYLGLAYLEKKIYSTAKHSFLESIKINPRYAKAHNNLGVLYEELGETNKAIESYKTASKINPNDPDSFYNLGLAYDNLGDGENSVEYMVLAKKAQEKKQGSDGIKPINEKLNQLWAKYDLTPENPSVASLGSSLKGDAGTPIKISTNQTSVLSPNPLLNPLDKPQISSVTGSGIPFKTSKELTVNLSPHWEVTKDSTEPAAEVPESKIVEETISSSSIAEVKAKKDDTSKPNTVSAEKKEFTVKADIMDKNFTGSQGTYSHPGFSSKSKEKQATSSSTKSKKSLVAQKPDKKTWVSDWIFEYPK